MGMRELRTRMLEIFAEGTTQSVVYDLEKRERRNWGEKEEKGKETKAEKRKGDREGERGETNSSNALDFDKF